MPINHKQQAFINEYMVNGHNATKAYMKAYPNSSEKACESNGARLIGKDKIKQAIAEQMAELGAETGWSIEQALTKLQDIITKSTTANQYSSAVSAIVAANRMFGLDKQTVISERTPDQPEGKEADVLHTLNKQYKLRLAGTDTEGTGSPSVAKQA